MHPERSSAVDPEAADPRAPGAPRIVAVMGSYRMGGVVDSALDLILRSAAARGARVEKIDLVARHIEFCKNCRECMRRPGRTRGECILEDDVDGILKDLETADGIVFGAPVNFGDVNALTRQLLERMVGFAQWPPGDRSPRLRRRHLGTPAVLVTSSAAPAVMTRLFARPLKTLREMARLVGARPIGTLVVGLADVHGAALSTGVRRRARRLGERLFELAAPTAGSRTAG